MSGLIYDHWKQVPYNYSVWPWKYFRPEEMACRGTGELQINNGLLDNLDFLRSNFGRPLVVLSAYRSPYHNARVGGAPLSEHLHANAVDLSIADLDKELLLRLAGEAGFTGFGYYHTFLHIDLGRAREWGREKWT
jgi:uncharacterized protein YcbK (DUF882 family)